MCGNRALACPGACQANPHDASRIEPPLRNAFRAPRHTRPPRSRRGGHRWQIRTPRGALCRLPAELYAGCPGVPRNRPLESQSGPTSTNFDEHMAPGSSWGVWCHCGAESVAEDGVNSGCSEGLAGLGQAKHGHPRIDLELTSRADPKLTTPPINTKFAKIVNIRRRANLANFQPNNISRHLPTISRHVSSFRHH